MPPNTKIEAAHRNIEDSTHHLVFREYERHMGESQKLDLSIEVIAEKTSIPLWGMVAIYILVFLIIIGIFIFCVRRFLKKRRTKDGKKGGDMKSVQLLEAAYKEKVQSDMEELTENAEEGNEEDKQSEQKLGRLTSR